MCILNIVGEGTGPCRLNHEEVESFFPDRMGWRERRGSAILTVVCLEVYRLISL